MQPLKMAATALGVACDQLVQRGAASAPHAQLSKAHHLLAVTYQKGLLRRAARPHCDHCAGGNVAMAFDHVVEALVAHPALQEACGCTQSVGASAARDLSACGSLLDLYTSLEMAADTEDESEYMPITVRPQRPLVC